MIICAHERKKRASRTARKAKEIFDFIRADYTVLDEIPAKKVH